MQRLNYTYECSFLSFCSRFCLQQYETWKKALRFFRNFLLNYDFD